MLPALAWLLSFANWNEGCRLRVVLLGAAGYGVIAGLVVVWNLDGVDLSQAPLAMALFLRSARSHCWRPAYSPSAVWRAPLPPTASNTVDEFTSTQVATSTGPAAWRPFHLRAAQPRVGRCRRVP